MKRETSLWPGAILGLLLVALVSRPINAAVRFDRPAPNVAMLGWWDVACFLTPRAPWCPGPNPPDPPLPTPAPAPKPQLGPEGPICDPDDTYGPC